ncbi:MAG: choice-of-anchor Q domain-containing protein [Polyangiales bacterium]
MKLVGVRCLTLFVALSVGCGDSSSGAGGAGGVGGSAGTPGSNSPPTQILLSASSVSECASPGSAIGTLTVSDPDAGDTHTLELLTQNDKFGLVDSELRTIADFDFDFETGPGFDVVVRATDEGGLTHEETIAISVRDELEISSLANAGPGTLRELLAVAPAGSTICVESGVVGTIEISTEAINVSTSLTLVGPGAEQLRVSGGDALPILVVEVSGDLTLRGVTLTNALGTAIRNDGTLTLTDSVVKDSTAAGTGRGACVTSAGALSVSRVTFRGCSAFNAGAIDIVGGSATFEAVTFSENSTTGNSGAAMVANASAVVAVTNSTFSGNFTTGTNRVGGAVAAFGGPAEGSLTLRHNTFFDNTATGEGGGLYMSSDTVVRLESNIFAGNTATAGPGIFRSASAVTTSLGYNLLEDGADSGLADGVDNDIVGSSAMLGPLTDNGGSTLTHLPDPMSPAHDVIPPESCSVDLDQRDASRPVGEGCDIGSVEF